ncbi:MAG TPA: hypothetical protein VMV45_02590 [Casimicrobiaceae bacterium]|nr:hypothetical protein [Casimicrobiaceae bacterium]
MVTMIRHDEYRPEIEVIANRDPAYDRPVVPTLEEIRYAQALRLQLREAYDRRSRTTTSPWWCSGAD